MRTRRLVAAIGVSTFLVAGLAACSSSNNDSSADKKTSTTTAATMRAACDNTIVDVAAGAHVHVRLQVPAQLVAVVAEAAEPEQARALDRNGSLVRERRERRQFVFEADSRAHARLDVERADRLHEGRRDGELLVIRNADGEELSARPGSETDAGPANDDPRSQHPYVRSLFQEAAMAMGLAA